MDGKDTIEVCKNCRFELYMTPIANACGKKISHLKTHKGWNGQLLRLAADLKKEYGWEEKVDVIKKKLYRPGKGGDTSDAGKAASLQG